MLRRDLIKTTTALATLGAASALPTSSWAQQRNFQEGADYVSLDKRIAGEAKPGQIEVIEFFWYSCPHCNSFEPRLEDWHKKLPKDVVLRRVPVAFRDSFAPQQRLFYSIEALGMMEQLHKKVFYAIHAEKQPLANQAAITDWIVKQGVDKTKFEQAYNSFSVESKVRRATQLTNDFKVTGVPALGIAGRFYTDGQLAQNMDRALAVTDWLVDQVRKGR